MQGFLQGEWSNQFPDKAVYYQKAAGSSVCPVSLGRWEGRQGKGKDWVPWRLRGLRMHCSTLRRETWVKVLWSPGQHHGCRPSPHLGLTL